MVKQFEKKIDRFDGGMANDLRSKETNKFAITKHFDALTFPYKLLPRQYSYLMGGEDKSFDIIKFLYAPATSEGADEYRLYGFAKTTGGKGAVYLLDMDLPGSDWSKPATAAYFDSALARNEPVSGEDEKVFFYYKNYIYAWLGGRYLARYDTTGAADWNDAYYDTIDGYTYLCQPVHHPNDDIAYFFHDNFVHKLDNTSPLSAKVLTLPSDLKIVGACPYGNYLAIACSSIDTNNSKSVVYLWDRDSSLATLSERIDFGAGEIIHMANLNNRIIVVQNAFCDKLFSGNSAKVYIKTISGQYGIILNELTTDDTGPDDNYFFPTAGDFVRDNKLYFPMQLKLNSDSRLGIWVVDVNGRIALDFIEEEATSYQGIYQIGNTWFIAHSDDGSTNTSYGTALSYSTTNPSIYESLIFNHDDVNLIKKLIGVSVSYEELLPITGIASSIGRVKLKYRKDTDLIGGSWTEIFDNTTIASSSLVAGKIYKIATVGTTDFTLIGASANTVGVVFTATGAAEGTGTALGNLINMEAVNINGATFPEFNEIQFRIESYGGATITGLKFKYEIIDKSLY